MAAILIVVSFEKFGIYTSYLLVWKEVGFSCIMG